MAVPCDVRDELRETGIPPIKIGLVSRARSVDRGLKAESLEFGENEPSSTITLAFHVDSALSGQDERAHAASCGGQVTRNDDTGHEEVVAVLGLVDEDVAAQWSAPRPEVDPSLGPGAAPLRPGVAADRYPRRRAAATQSRTVASGRSNCCARRRVSPAPAAA